MSRYLDPRFSALEPYTPGEQPQSRGLIKLNTNESPYPPSPQAQRAAAQQAAALNLYPDPTAGRLLGALAAMLGVGEDQVFAGNGSDEILAFCFQALCPAGVAFADLTYGFYPVYARLYGVDALELPLKEDFSLDVGDYAGLGRTVVIANPNAPTGLALPRGQIERLLESNSGSLVIIDEAYVEFGAETAVPLLERHDNLLVVGTFSKSRSMAGARLGYAAGSAALIADLNRIKYSFNPYNLNRMTLAAGAAAAGDTDYYAGCARKVMATRARVQRQLCEMGFVCTNSKANFIFATHAGCEAKALYTYLKEKDILVRWFDRERIRNHLRISVGTDEEMDALLKEVRAYIENAQQNIKQ